MILIPIKAYLVFPPLPMRIQHAHCLAQLDAFSHFDAAAFRPDFHFDAISRLQRRLREHTADDLLLEAMRARHGAPGRPRTAYDGYISARAE